MSKPDAPKPPDPSKTAGAQTAQNIGTAIAQQSLGNVNQVTPYGNLTYRQSGTTNWTDPNTGKVYKIPQMTATQSFNGMGRKINAQNKQTQYNLANLASEQSGRIGDLLSSPMSMRGVPDRASLGGTPEYGRLGAGPQLRDSFDRGDVTHRIAGAGSITGDIAGAGAIRRNYGPTDYSADRQRVEKALMSRLNPQINRDRESLRTSLINQGITEGSEAFDRAMNRVGEQANDARMQAILAGGQEQSRLAGLARDSATFTNSAQAQQFGQNAAKAQFANQSQAQRFGQNTAQAQFANDAQAQDFTQSMAATQFGNDTRQQGWMNDAYRTAQNNQTAGQAFADQVTAANFQNQNRSSALQEQYAQRNQPINEIAALMSGSQVQAPNFINPNTPQLANVDRAGLEMQNYNQRLAGWQQQQANQQALMGGLFGLGSGALMGGYF